MWCQELDILVYIYYIYIVKLSIIIWIFLIDRQQLKPCSYIDLSSVTTEICWYFHYSCSKLTSHACALLIDNVGNYLYMYFNNGSFKSEVDAHRFNLREKKNQKLAGLWLAGVMVNRIGIYGSKVAEGLSAFQRRFCCFWSCITNSCMKQFVGMK